jgi:hypothetical protein
MKSLSIAEAARRAGVRSSALRYYEEIGILPAATRVNGRRHYHADMVRMIVVLRFAQQAVDRQDRPEAVGLLRARGHREPFVPNALFDLAASRAFSLGVCFGVPTDFVAQPRDELLDDCALDGAPRDEDEVCSPAEHRLTA